MAETDVTCQTKAEYWYFATPYSRYPAGITDAFDGACTQAALLLDAGIRVYSPIAYTHPIGLKLIGSVSPQDSLFWVRVDRPFIAHACGMIVCQMEGWRESIGIRAEMSEFEAVGKPIVFMQPGHVPADFALMVPDAVL